jgi:hypothetical protein
MSALRTAWRRLLWGEQRPVRPRWYVVLNAATIMGIGIIYILIVGSGDWLKVVGLLVLVALVVPLALQLLDQAIFRDVEDR